MGDTLPPSGGAMPWKECHVMDERLRFVARLLEGEKMAPLCAELGISRKTGYKIFGRYKDCGVEAFTDRSRRPHLQAISTVHAVLDRHSLVKRRRRRRHTATGTGLSRPTEPNALWCADYKGEFMLGNRRYCYPLTITDFATRYLLVCEALSSTQARFAFTVFERAFTDFGLPAVIRTDNGVPFAGPTALYRLSKLAVWWLRLG